MEIIVWEGKISVLQVTDKKTTGTPHFVELGHSQPSLYTDDVVSLVADAAIKGVQALRLNDCAVHAEVKVQDKIPYIMEIGARLGGDFISTLLTPLSTGIDMVGAAIDVAMGIAPNLRPISEPKGVAIRYFAPTPGVVQKIEGEEQLLSDDVFDAGIYVNPGDVVHELKSSLDRSGHVITMGKTASEAIKRAEQIVEKVKIITI